MIARRLTLASALAAAAAAHAAPVFLQRLDAGANLIENGAYGYGLSGDEARVAAGEPGGLSGGTPAVPGGVVEIWRREGAGLVREQRVLPPVPTTAGFFGVRTALSGDWLAVLDMSGGERVHLYQRAGSAWSLRQTLMPGPDDGSWGIALGLLDDCLVIGSPGYTPGAGASSSGAVHRYRRSGTTWVEQALITGLDDAANRTFGDAVALDRRSDGVLQLAVGAGGRNQGNGAVYVFRDDGAGWLQEQRLQLADAQVDERLGSAVALRGGTLLSGAPQATVSMQALAGRAVVWRRTGSGDFPWVRDATLADPAPAQGDKFGQSVALVRENEALVGVPWRDVVVIASYADAGVVKRYLLGRSAATCAPAWLDAGGLGNPAALPQAGALHGGTLAGGRLVGIGAIGATVQSTAAAGFVDALYEDGLFTDAFDCP